MASSCSPTPAKDNLLVLVTLYPNAPSYLSNSISL
nr:MAG TPA: hypothetical protein [Caudoviricetes sp.]